MLISGVQQTDLVLFLIQSTSQKLNNKYFCLVTTLISKKPPISPYPGVDSVQLLGCVQLCDPIDCNRPASLSITNSQSLLRLMFIDCHPPISSSCRQSFSASGSFQMSQFFTSGGQSIEAEASASVLPMNIQV